MNKFNNVWLYFQMNEMDCPAAGDREDNPQRLRDMGSHFKAKIHLLSTELTHQIAAGEVIERPASILKELLENSLDAGATVLQIELVQGGCASLRITDNGAGMDPVDVPLAFQRHATSKLAVFDDLYRLRTFGFRGEALPSIAAVARVELLTRTAQALTGTRIVVENGQVIEKREAGCPTGTSIFVTRIFDFVPVRKKFLKTEATEQAACLEAISRIALSQPGVKIRVVNNGRLLWDLPAVAERGERVGMILGKDTAGRLLSVAGRREGMEISGYISRPEVTRANGKSLYCFINGRCVRDPLLNSAVMTACRNILEAKRYPAAVLFIDLPPEDVDINVHPAKLEVRFRNPREIYGLIVESILAALAGVAPFGAEGETSSPVSGAKRPGAPAYQNRIDEALKRYTLYGGAKKTTFPAKSSIGYRGGELFGSRAADGPPWSTNIPGFSESPVVENRGGHQVSPNPEAAEKIRPATGSASAGSDTVTPPEPGQERKRSLAEMTYLGQTAGTYLVFSGDDELLIVDQHAAHERILYENLRHGEGDKKTAVQPLLIPEIVALTPGDYGLIMDHREIFEEAGMEIAPFGGHDVAIRSLPAMLDHLNPRELLEDLLEQITGEGTTVSWQEKREKLLISLACKGAVKAGQILAEGEVARLCRDLDRLPFAATCPHGRPVWIAMTAKQLAGLFKRS